MNIGVYQSAAALSALERWQDVVSQNITSGQVPGYRKRTIDFSTVALGERRPDPTLKNMDADPAMFPRTKLGINFSPGETQATRGALDVALESEGFFEVEMSDGTRAYTRAGQMHLDSNRQLMSAAGHAMISTSDSPITLNPTGGEISIAADGSIVQGNATLGKFKVVNFRDTSKLMPAAGGAFVPVKGTESIPVDAPRVLQGYIEASNVTPLREMVALIMISRAYESNQKIISNTDQLLNRVLDTLG